MDSVISTATRRNWEKLNTASNGRLKSRANKKLSKKCFIPVEYFENKENIAVLQSNFDSLSLTQCNVGDIIFSLAVMLLKEKNIYKKEHVQNVLSDYSFSYIDQIENHDWPTHERDLLGISYQYLQFEGEKNKKGSYFTPKAVVKNMVRHLDFSNGQIFLDPCCGSGSFLMELDANPNQIFGIDIDPLAVFIAKINLLLKYSDLVFKPQIECRDYLAEIDLFSMDSLILHKNFDYIMTNPPWGAVLNIIAHPDISSKETFSLFFVKSFEQLKQNGHIRFLLPEAVTNVKVHKDIRDYILKHCCIDSFTMYEDSFTGVTTKYIDIACSKQPSRAKVSLFRNGEVETIAISSFWETDNHIFNFMKSIDIDIVDKVKSVGKYNLSNSDWALGVVTGDNKNKVVSSRAKGMEKIYTGKEIQPYLLKSSDKYILYDRSQLQQVAKEEYYRADEKLVYKFISNKLTFAYDDKQRLFLNSANILIPKIPCMSIKTVLAFLNSELYQYLYVQMFGEIKILKGNLVELPFPQISEQQDLYIKNIVDGIMAGSCSPDQVQEVIYEIFNISEEQIKHIRRTLNGKVA